MPAVLEPDRAGFAPEMDIGPTAAVLTEGPVQAGIGGGGGGLAGDPGGF